MYKMLFRQCVEEEVPACGPTSKVVANKSYLAKVPKN